MMLNKNIITSDVHTHTTFCDGECSMEDVVIGGIERGLNTIGLSFHSFTPFDKSYCIKDYFAYDRELNNLREKYRGKITILGGVELDLYGERPSVCDYVIGSVHYIKKGYKYYPIDYSNDVFDMILSEVYKGDALSLVKDYYIEYSKLSTIVKPNIYGHIDLACKYNRDNKYFDESGSDYLKLTYVAIDSLKKGDIVEINFGRINRGIGDKYPNDCLLNLLIENGNNFMLSSDAHSKIAVGNNFEKMTIRLKKLGVKSLCMYDNGILKQVEL